MCTFPSYLLEVLRSMCLLNILFTSAFTELVASWEFDWVWFVEVNSGVPENEETVVSAALPTALLGSKVFGRRSGRPDCITEWKGWKKFYTVLRKKHCTCWNTLQDEICAVISKQNVLSIPLLKLIFNFAHSYYCLLQCLLCSHSWLDVGVKAAGCWCWFGLTVEAHSQQSFSKDRGLLHAAS